MRCAMFSSIPGLYLLDISSRSPPAVMTKMSPDIDKCPLGVKSLSDENRELAK